MYIHTYKQLRPNKKSVTLKILCLFSYNICIIHIYKFSTLVLSFVDMIKYKHNRIFYICV